VPISMLFLLFPGGHHVECLMNTRTRLLFESLDGTLIALFYTLQPLFFYGYPVGSLQPHATALYEVLLGGVVSSQDELQDELQIKSCCSEGSVSDVSGACQSVRRPKIDTVYIELEYLWRRWLDKSQLPD
jgi:hypothetical protein